ncbi:MAG: type II toxin-antitoxin system VapC family toxin [Acidobacteriia bacterium]|nr:type II toxin-antitoxin system VapC family toxin [Terriglobia bacterium]
MKTYVFDASALFAYLQKTAGGPKVGDLLKEAAKEHARVLMSAVNYGEVYGRILRDGGQSQAHLAANVIRALPVELLDATPQRALQAAEVKAAYRLHYADSFAAALAFEHKATLVTSDADFRKLGHSVPVVWLKP